MICHFSCTKCREVVAPFRTLAHSLTLTAVPINVMGVQSSRKGGIQFLLDWTPAPLHRSTNCFTYHFGSGKSEHKLQLITVIWCLVIILNWSHMWLTEKGSLLIFKCFTLPKIRRCIKALKWSFIGDFNVRKKKTNILSLMLIYCDYSLEYFQAMVEYVFILLQNGPVSVFFCLFL